MVLGNQSLNCLMYADDLQVISPSPEGLQQSLDVIHNHAQDWKLKVNTKKSNIIISSGNGQSKNKVNFEYGNETLQIVEKQSYLGIEMSSSFRYTYVREILSKKAIKVLSITNRSFSNTQRQLRLRTNSLMPWLNPCYFAHAKFGDRNYYHTKHLLIKVQLNKLI